MAKQVRLQVFCSPAQAKRLAAAAKRAGIGWKEGGRSAWIRDRALEAAERDQSDGVGITFAPELTAAIAVDAKRDGITFDEWARRALGYSRIARHSEEVPGDPLRRPDGSRR